MSHGPTQDEHRPLLQQLPPSPPQGQPRPVLPQRQRSSLKHRLSVFDIARLTVCMLGVQFTWTVELGYGTPYLLSLGIPKTLTPLVWLAGPLSGLIIQPVVGVFSDTLDWKMGRRRPFIIIGAALTVFSMYMVAYARELALLIVGGGDSSSDQASLDAIKGWTIGFAVVGFYCLDFSINAVQASCRSLIMDIPPTDQQEICNAWSGWMNNLGSVVGFFAGNLDLVKYVPWLGNTQIKALANIAILFFAGTLGLSCLSVIEVPYVPTDEDKKRSVVGTVGNIWKAFRKLPAEIQRICNVQFFAWMGWFPFLFYSTTWVAEIMNRYQDGPDRIPGNVAERAGSFALLCWAGVAVVGGISIPKVTPQEIGPAWPRNPFTLRNLWTMSLVWFATCMGMTWFVDDLWAATFVIALCGVPWAVALWVPFAMVGEIVSDMKDRLAAMTPSQIDSFQGSEENTVCEPEGYGAIQGRSQDEGQDEETDTLGERQRFVEHGLSAAELEAEARKKGPHLDAGLVLGVHNMYIVFPQFVDAVITSCLFAMIGTTPRDQPSPTPRLPGPGDGDWTGGFFSTFAWKDEPEPVGWVLRFGGLMALVAAYLTRRL